MVSRANLCRRHGSRKLRAAFLASVVVSVVLASPVRAGDAHKVFIFGDSISDTGNGCFLPFVPLSVSPVPECQDARYFLGRTTQGPVWAEVLASNLTGTPLVGQPLNQLVELDPGPPPTLPAKFFEPFFPGQMAVSSAPPASLLLFGSDLGISPEVSAEIFAGGANVAVSGAETRNLALEVGLFLAQAGALDPRPTDAFVVWIGGGDIRSAVKDPLAGEIEEVIEKGVAEILGAIAVLNDGVGARRFLIPNLPDVGLTLDLDEAQSNLATAATKLWNVALDAGLAGLAAQIDVDVVPLDAFCLTEALIKFGRLDTESSCLEGNDYPACKGKLLFDDIHPTSAAHRTLGIAGQAALECAGEGPWHRWCVSRVTRDQVRRGLLPLAGALAIRACVGKTH